MNFIVKVDLMGVFGYNIFRRLYIPYTFALAHRVTPRYNTIRIKNELREHERVLPHKKEVMKNEEEFSQFPDGFRNVRAGKRSGHRKAVRC